MPREQAWQLVKAYQDALTADTPPYRFTPAEHAGVLIIQLGVVQAYTEATQRAEEARFEGDQAGARVWTSVSHLLSTCLEEPTVPESRTRHALL